MDELLEEIARVARRFGLSAESIAATSGSPEAAVNALFREIQRAGLSRDRVEALQEELERLLGVPDETGLESEGCSESEWISAFDVVAGELSALAAEEALDREMLYLVSDFVGSKEQKIEICTANMSPSRLISLLKDRLDKKLPGWTIIVVRGSKFGGGHDHLLLGQ